MRSNSHESPSSENHTDESAKNRSWPPTVVGSKGPQGQKRSADVIGAAIMVAKIATGEVADTKRDAATEAKPRCWSN